MIIGNFVIPDSIETSCFSLKVDTNFSKLKLRSLYPKVDPNEKKAWIETMKVNHKAVHFNLTKNMRNCHQIIHLAKTFRDNYVDKSWISFSPETI